MQTVPETPTARKPAKAFYAHVYDQAGVLVQGADGRIYFLTDDDLVVFTVEMAPFTCVLGEVGLADTQALLDGDKVRKCSQTLMEVS